MLNKRIFVKKKENFNVKERDLLLKFKNDLNLQDLNKVSYYIIYDIFNTTEEEYELTKNKVFSELNTDDIYLDIDLKDKVHFAVGILPNQFDSRAASAEECISLLYPDTQTKVKSGELLIFEGIKADECIKIQEYYINKIECYKKDLSVLELPSSNFIEEETYIEGFRNLNEQKLNKLLQEYGLSYTLEDLKFIQEYYIKEEKDPILGELKIIDTYWSDHCRHTTFNTTLQNIEIKDQKIKKSYEKYLKIKEEVSPNKDITLMDMATSYGKYAIKNGIKNNVEKTKEDNAISLIIEEDNQEFLYQFKNETHNHPTEIEPFGGAATCIGGAIRDPLSGRAYVYQGLRISGGANPLEKVEDTLKGKLPQKLISTKSADGFSSYGNQIGLATTFVKEIYHPGYKAKHLEAGAVVGIVKKENVRREDPSAGDVVLLLGGKTGMDGIGGATGSSKKHDKDSTMNSAVEVQKGNAPEERKIQRLFLNKEILQMIKKSNDFGAGGVSVAIGELASGIDIYLEKIPLKVLQMKPSDIATSESQERMAVVIEQKDVQRFEELAQKENVMTTLVAKINDGNYLKMYYEDKEIISLNRDFLDTGGVKKYQDVVINEFEEYKTCKVSSLKECFNNINLVDNKNMETLFDSTVGATTVLMPYGGKYQLTKNQVSVQKIPFMKKTTSHVAYGFNPFLMQQDPYTGTILAIVDSTTKLAASGVKLKDMNLSFQEYFKRLEGNKENFGEVASALLGAIEAQENLQICALGGKDSMSGTYEDIHVPNTLISFAFGTGQIDKVISSEMKKENEYIYLLDVDCKQLNFDIYKENLKVYESLIEKNLITSAYGVSENGIAMSLCKMLMGNKLGCKVSTDEDLFIPKYGSIIFTTNKEIDQLEANKIGITTNDGIVKINSYEESIENLINYNHNTFNSIYAPLDETLKETKDTQVSQINRQYSPQKTDKVKVFIPVFAGSNSEFEMKQAFEAEGCEVKIQVFKNNTSKLVKQSIEQFENHIKDCNIIAIPGGFSGADEPDGSGKYIVNVLSNEKIAKAIEEHLEQDNLILGICNGFQALIKSGLITNSKIQNINETSPTLFKNDCNYHISKMVNTKAMTNNSPWLKGIDLNKQFSQVISHGEGKIIANEEEINKLIQNDQVAFCYVNNNPNGSMYNIEGLISPCGKILGKMAHSERFTQGLYQNITGEKELNIFKNAVNYFKGE